MRRHLTAIVTLASLSAFSTGVGTAQNLPQVQPGDWLVSCELKGCLVSTVAVEDDVRLMTLTFGVGTIGGPNRMAILTPLGTALGSGLRVLVGSIDRTYRFSTCMPDGCVVVVDMTPGDIDNMAVQPSLTASFSAVNRTTPYSVTVDLSELGEAVAAARSNAGTQ